MPIIVEKIVHHLPLLCTRFIDSPKAFPDCLQRKANNHKSFSIMIISQKGISIFFHFWESMRKESNMKKKKFEII